MENHVVVVVVFHTQSQLIPNEAPGIWCIRHCILYRVITEHVQLPFFPPIVRSLLLLDI